MAALVSDIAIEFRVKNGRLKRAILAEWPSYIAFCSAHGISYSKLNKLLCMRAVACNLDGWREVAIDIATALHLEPEDLWPAEMKTAQLRQNNGEFAVTLEEAARLTTARVNTEALAQLTKGLTPREIRAITSLARGETFDEAAKGAGHDGGDVSRERIRQIGLKAMRKMQSAARLNDIGFHDVIEEI